MLTQGKYLVNFQTLTSLPSEFVNDPSFYSFIGKTIDDVSLWTPTRALKYTSYK